MFYITPARLSGSGSTNHGQKHGLLCIVILHKNFIPLQERLFDSFECTHFTHMKIYILCCFLSNLQHIVPITPPAPPASLSAPQIPQSRTLQLSPPASKPVSSSSPLSRQEDWYHTPHCPHTWFRSRCHCRTSHP